MTITLTQVDATRPPVGVAVTGLPVVAAPAAVRGIVQRSTDGVQYSTVRGMVDMAPDGSGVLTSTDDYEFRAGVVNTYRAGPMEEIVCTWPGSSSGSWVNAFTGQTWDAANAAFTTAGGFGVITHASANTVFRTVLSLASIGDLRLGVSVKGSPASISGDLVQFAISTHYIDSNNFYDTNIEFGVSGAITLRIRCLVGGVLTSLYETVVPDTYANTKTFRVEVDVTGNRFRARIWDPATRPRPDWQADKIIPAACRIGSGKVGLGSFRSTSNSNSNYAHSFDDLTLDTGTPKYLQSQTITPDLAGFWLCSTMRSFLNCAPRVVDFEEPSREARGGSQYVAGRTLPISQAELMGGRQWKLTLHVPSLTQARQLEYVIASGDVFFLQTPDDCAIPRGYYRVGAMGSTRVIPTGSSRLFDLPLIECAAPGPDVATASATWDSVIALYGTWPDVVAAEATWESLKAMIGDPSEVIVT